MRTTQKKGDLALTKAIHSFTSKGYDVALPITESAAYDLIVDIEDQILRIQVKFTSEKDVDLRNIHSNSKGYVVKKNKRISYDWLYVLHENGKEYLFKECFIGRRSVRLNEQKEFSNT